MIRGRPPRSTASVLLEAQGLPVADITDAHLEHFFFVGSDGSPTGLVRKGVRSIYLLTTTAEAFFNRLGYERMGRSRAPSSIKRTREFAGLCPVSSVFMVKAL